MRLCLRGPKIILVHSQEAVATWSTTRSSLPFRLTTPIALNSLGQQREGNVVRASAGVAEFGDHAHRAVGVASVDEDGRGALKLGVCAEPACDRVAGSFVIGRLGV